MLVCRRVYITLYSVKLVSRYSKIIVVLASCSVHFFITETYTNYSKPRASGNNLGSWILNIHCRPLLCVLFINYVLEGINKSVGLEKEDALNRVR